MVTGGRFIKFRFLLEDMNNEFFSLAICGTLEYFNKVYSVVAYLTRLSFKNKKIDSISDLNELINQKKKKYGFSGKITAKIDLEGEVSKALCRQIGDNHYEIVFNKDFLETKVLDHELYHVFDGHCDNISNNDVINALKYSFYKEPKTIFYNLVK